MIPIFLLQEAFNDALLACFTKLSTKKAVPMLLLIVDVVPMSFTQDMLCEVQCVRCVGVGVVCKQRLLVL